MLCRRFFFRYLVGRDRPPRRSRIRRTTTDRKNLKLKTDGADFVDGQKLKQKRGRPGVDSEEGRIRKKRRIGGNVAVDRISELPEPIIHHILSYLPCAKDTVRMTTLSKRWKSVMDSYLIFDIDERWFHVKLGEGRHNRIKARELRRKKFQRYVDKSLVKMGSVPSINRFRLRMKSASFKMKSCMKGWIHSALKRNVKELDVCYDGKGQNLEFHCDVHMSTSLTSLKLSGSLLYAFAFAKLSNLRILSIKNTMLLNEFVIKKFEESCPMLEDLRLVRCCAFSSLIVSSLRKLRRVEVHVCSKLSSIEIKAETLETFCYFAAKYQICDLKLDGSQNVRNLTLKTSMTDENFDLYLSRASQLEKLVLQGCNKLEKISFLSLTLKSLSLIRCRKLSKVSIEAPKLYSFEYCGHRMPFSSMNVFGLRRAKLAFSPGRKTSKGIVDYKNLFGAFDIQRDFKLIIYSKQNMTIYEKPRDAHLDPRTFHKLELTESLTGVLNTVDNWLRECCGRNLILVAPSSELTEKIHSLIIDREKNPNCCGIYYNKCWRHYLTNVITSSSNRPHKINHEFTWMETKESRLLRQRSRSTCHLLGIKEPPK